MSSTADWLSLFLQLVPVAGQVDIRCYFASSWQIEHAAGAPGEMHYHIVLEGEVCFVYRGQSYVLTPGDIILFPYGSPHVFHDGKQQNKAQLQSHVKHHLVVKEIPGDGVKLDMLCGRFVAPPRQQRLIHSYLPAVLVVHAAQDSSANSAQLHNLVQLIKAEADLASLGARAMLNALSGALFALILRQASELKNMPHGLLALAASPRLAPVIEAMLANPQHPWTLPKLADLCNMSRATLARQFKQKAGCSASDMLNDIRMTMAASALEQSAVGIGLISEQIGYQSEAAFQRAFKQYYGLTPSGWRQHHRVD